MAGLGVLVVRSVLLLVTVGVRVLCEGVPLRSAPASSRVPVRCICCAGLGAGFCMMPGLIVIALLR